jgi:multiple sugar transport system permease protein
LLAPALILLLVFEFFPLFYGFFISMCNWRLNCGDNFDRFIWFDNYTRAFSDPDMWSALIVTVSYVVISVPVQLGLALIIAYLLFQKIRGKEMFRVAFFLPYITSTVASAAVRGYLYSQDKGLFNNIFKAIGLQPLRWLGEPAGVFAMIASPLGMTLPDWAQGPSLALVALVVYTTWVFVGFDTTIFLAGLGNISPELYDAAKVDGASGWTLFRNITFPLLSPTTFFLVTVTIIGTFRAFNHIWVMTQGGPIGTTTSGSIFIFKQIIANRYGYSAALSFILFFVILLVTVLQHRLSSRRVVYD